MIKYCNFCHDPEKPYFTSCKDKYGLNERAFELFDSKCDICGRPGTVSICPLTEIDWDLKVIIWKKPIKIQVGKRTKDIMIDMFTNI